MEDVNISNGSMLTNEVKIKLNMLYVLMLDGFAEEIDCVDVVVVDEASPQQGVVQLLKKLTEPACLHHDMVLCLSTTGDNILVLQGLEDKVVTK
jgi:hypothetical protein